MAKEFNEIPNNVNAGAAGVDPAPSFGGVGAGAGSVDNTHAANAFGGMTKNISTFDKAFGYMSYVSAASHFTALIAKMVERNPYLSKFRCGVIDGVNPEMGSAAYVAAPADENGGHWMYGILFFEHGQSVRFREINGKETYYTLASLFGQEGVMDSITKQICEQQNLPSVQFMVMNCIPDLGKTLTEEWAIQLMGQLTLGIFGRIPGYLGQLKLTRGDRFVAQVTAVDEGSLTDVNGSAQRADLMVQVEHTQTGSFDTNPTLMSSERVQGYPSVAGVGYINLRYTGRRAPENGVQDYKQLQAEVVVSLMDSQSSGAMVPIERQLIELAAFAEIAAIGGWRERFMHSLNKTDRRFSRVMEYVEWGDKRPDLSKIDGNREAIEECLNMFAYPEAALVVNHRAGNGIGGLSTMFSEVSQGNTGTLSNILTILDNMAPKGATVFTQRFAEMLKVNTITCNHVVIAGVPTVSGQYFSNSQKRSFQDQDLVSVLSKVGDNQHDAYTYLYAQSYSHRQFNATEQRLYLLKLAASLFGSKQPVVTGESTDLAINPKFAKALLDYVRDNCIFQVNGVTAVNSLANTLFFNNGGENFTLSGNGPNSFGSDYNMSFASGNYSPI